MYVPSAFREEDRDALHAIMRGTGLAQLITATPDGLMATALPLLLAAEEGQFGTLYGHLARANRQWSAPVLGEAMVLFAGPDAYVSPGWYPSKAAHGRVVPTWNYVAVQAFGTVEFFGDEERLLGLVTRLTARHEEGRAAPWAVSDAPKDYVRAQLRGIVGLRLEITRVEGARKLSQNKSAEDRAGVIEGLTERGGFGDLQVASAMRAARR